MANAPITALASGRNKSRFEWLSALRGNHSRPSTPAIVSNCPETALKRRREETTVRNLFLCKWKKQTEKEAPETGRETAHLLHLLEASAV